MDLNLCHQHKDNRMWITLSHIKAKAVAGMMNIQANVISVQFIMICYQFHPILKESVISPLLKKCTIYKHSLSNYCPSLTSVISKVIECIVKSHLIDHLTSSKLLNPHQSAYCKHHYTETALLYIHDHLITAVGSCILHSFD